MNRKVKGLLLISFCLSFMAGFVTPARAHGDTSLTAGNVLNYAVLLVQSQDWTIEGRWYNLTAPSVPHYTNFTESRKRTIDGTLTVDVIAVRLYDVELHVTYDLHYYTDFWDRTLNDSTPANDYTGTWNQTRYPAGPNIISYNVAHTSSWNYTDTFDLEINKLTRDFNSMTGYGSATLSTDFYTSVSTGNDYCSFWIFPNADLGETYAFMHVGMIQELIGDYQHYTASGNPVYQIENTRTYYPPGGGKGFMQTVLVASYDATLAELTSYSATHAYTVDYKNYVNEFLFDQDTGVLLQYHRSYRVMPFFIRQSSTPNTPLQQNTDIYNLEFTMTLQESSNVWLGIGLLETILLWVLIPVGIIVVIAILYWRSRRH